MSTTDLGTTGLPAVKTSVVPLGPPPPSLHRIATVRRQQGISLRALARQQRTTVRELEAEEDESADLRLSRLYWWQDALDVPVADLLVESNGPLSPPILQRAQLVRVMKTVAAIMEKTESVSIRRLTQTLVNQLIEIMPELEGVSPWHAVGQRRTLDEPGRIVERVYSENVWYES